MNHNKRFIAFIKDHKRLVALILAIVLIVNIVAIAISSTDTGNNISRNGTDSMTAVSPAENITDPVQDITDPAQDITDPAGDITASQSASDQPEVSGDQYSVILNNSWDYIASAKISALLQEKNDAFYEAYANADYEKALEEISYVIDHFDAGSTAYSQRALVYSQLGKNPEAAEDLLAALELNPDDLSSLTLLAQTYIAESKYIEASDALSSSIRLIEDQNPPSEEEASLLPSLYYNRGICSLQTEDYEQAEKDFLKVTELPDTDGLAASASEILESIKDAADGSIHFVVDEDE
ncbi:MAG: tetratricopeptide repeat protein [Parasporobacterium sp.]|nr:tetratricopeptide repeat protein [Parasporobacterium sp.]